MIRNLLAVLAFACLGLAAQAQEDALGIPGPIVFEDEAFDLVWTSHPTEALYKQEYLPEGEVVEAYGQMFMVDVLLDGATAEGAAGNMIAGLRERQATDPMVNFDIIQNDATGEIILDFLLSDESTGVLIVEWNAYRYVPLEGGLAMFGISRRGYGDDVDGFLADLAQSRPGTIEALAGLDLPEITIAD